MREKRKREESYGEKPTEGGADGKGKNGKRKSKKRKK